jgi:phosphate transport system permease protein
MAFPTQVEAQPSVSRPPIAERFRVARPTLLFDRFMTHFIKVGGIGVVTAVLLIFVFIVIQIWPLFQGAHVRPEQTFQLPHRPFAVLGSDEWGELPFLVESDGTIHLLDTAATEGVPNRGLFTVDNGLPPDTTVSTVNFNQRSSELLLGTQDGRFGVVRIGFRAEFPPDAGRVIQPVLTVQSLLRIGRDATPIQKLAYGDSGTRKLAAALQLVNGQFELHAVTLSQRRTLFGVGPVEVDREYDLTPLLAGEPVHLLVPHEAESVLVANRAGDVQYLYYGDGEFYPRQSFRPFNDLPDPTIASMNFVLADVSVVFTSATGVNRVFSLYRDPVEGRRIYGPSKSFPDLNGGATFYSASMRNKSFLLGNGQFASLRYSTTENIRWEDQLPFQIVHATLGPRYDRMLFLDTESRLHMYGLRDPHPVAGWKTYFGKIQYEGQAEPAYVWQSTGMTDDFERKLSLVPLIIGTLKGTLYAMVFALPIAMLAAVYTSQFIQPRIKRVVKPIMEIMASLPSVVLGFLAALWLAPIVSNRVPSVLLAMVAVTAGAFLVGWFWGDLPSRHRRWVQPGYEFIVFTPLLLLFAWIGWQCGPIVERMFFVVTDPETGARVADFRLWYPTVTGLGFEQRNSFVVGFVMGFAVIPIIFTIAEDSLSNVPDAFRSGSLALGASRWQTAIRIVLPTASAGIFSAIMIGLGRAVGETMIVVMATGNTPVTELNIFTGMRTLSANIAVELPEAPYLGTLYRTLFLGAMVLFLMTFVINTVAEILRQHLREKYKAVE